MAHLHFVFELLSRDQWKLKLSKCSFAQTEISYLGHVISAAGVGTDPSKLDSIARWPTLVSVKELRSFLGLAGYYRWFVRHFGLISKPLTQLRRTHCLSGHQLRKKPFRPSNLLSVSPLSWRFPISPSPSPSRQMPLIQVLGPY